MPRKSSGKGSTFIQAPRRPRSKARARAYGEAVAGLFGKEVGEPGVTEKKGVTAKFGVLQGGRKRLRPDSMDDFLPDGPLNGNVEGSNDRVLSVSMGAARHESDGRPSRSDTPEYNEQVALVDWIKISLPFCRGYIMTHGNEGERSYAAAYRAQKMGLCKGAHDLFIARPAMGFHGLFIEMKQNRRYVPSERAQPTFRAQLEFKDRMILVGYSAHFAYGFEHARQIITNYFGIVENEV